MRRSPLPPHSPRHAQQRRVPSGSREVILGVAIGVIVGAAVLIPWLLSGAPL